MLVSVYCINKGTPSEYYGLKKRRGKHRPSLCAEQLENRSRGEKVGAAERIHSQRGKSEGQTGKSNGKFCCSA